MSHTIAEEYQEKIDCRSVINIPMNIKKGEVHPTLNRSLFKGINFEHHTKLYSKLQETFYETKLGYPTRLLDVKSKFKNLRQNIQSRTQQEITIAAPHKGKLKQRTKQDTENFWNASKELFQIITDILRDAGLAKTVPILPTTTRAKLKKDVAAQKIVPGVTSLPVAKHLDEAGKRTNILL